MGQNDFLEQLLSRQKEWIQEFPIEGGIGLKGDGKENSKEIPEIEECFLKEN